MAKKYGIPYQGSKSNIAEDIIANLPAGNRLVDLFGGGFAISHCALLSGKWKHILYNDINPLLIPLIRDAIAGKYSYERFVPKWITREEFHARKETDGYIKWIWSFGNNGHDYLYGRDIEEIKRSCHEWVFHNTPIIGLGNIECDIPCDAEHYSERRKFLLGFNVKELGRLFNLQHLEAFERCIQLERIERLTSLNTFQNSEKLEMTCMDYREYEYQDGDIVYCDIPYQNSVNVKRTEYMYNNSFDFGEFYQWAVYQPFPIYFSSYKLGGVVWESDKKVLVNPTSHAKVRREVLYCVDNNFIPKKMCYQGLLFER